MEIIYTVGYEGTDLPRFLRTLLAAGVEAVADVRAIAGSRKKGFSKKALQSALLEVGIHYEHFVELGDPKPGRVAAREGRYLEFVGIYTAHLNGEVTQIRLDELVSSAKKSKTCLLCFERDPQVCHRTIVAKRISMRGFSIVDLYADSPEQYERTNILLARGRSGQSATAA